jgi:hypothetical protein
MALLLAPTVSATKGETERGKVDPTIACGGAGVNGWVDL